MTPLTVEPTGAVEPTSARESTTVVEATGSPSVLRRALCERCRCPRPVSEVPEASGLGVAIGSSEAVPSGDMPGGAGEGLSPQEQLATLLPGLQEHPNLDCATLGYHAGQSDATTRDGYFHAAINEARSFLEALVINIALEEERPREESIVDFRKRREAHCGFPSCCRYLKEIGFFNLDERVMVQHAYTLDRAGGIPEGASDKSWSRLVRRMVWTAGQYVIRRYDAWKSGCRC